MSERIPKKWVLLLSGGLDSTILAAELVANGHQVEALSILYGQRHSRELESAKAIAAHFKIPHRVVDLNALQPLISNSSQTGFLEVPDGHYEEASMKLTVVPNRNMILISVALGLAVNLRFDGVAYAAHAGDHAIYPDCRKSFVDAMDKAAQLCDWHSVRLWAPYVDLSKTEIVQKGIHYQVPFELTWSCYKGLDFHCGRCGTCVERREAFQLAGMKDPCAYAESDAELEAADSPSQILQMGNQIS